MWNDSSSAIRSFDTNDKRDERSIYLGQQLTTLERVGDYPRILIVFDETRLRLPFLSRACTTP